MPERGVIYNRQRGSQIRDFSKIRLDGDITPTDLDSLVEYHNEYFVFAETKYNGNEMNKGQKLALERLCDACERSGKPSILFVTTHNNNNGEDIDMGLTIVIAYRYKFAWHKSPKRVYLKDAIHSFIHNKGHYDSNLVEEAKIIDQDTIRKLRDIKRGGAVHLAFPRASMALCGHWLAFGMQDAGNDAVVNCHACLRTNQERFAVIRDLIARGPE